MSSTIEQARRLAIAAVMMIIAAGCAPDPSDIPAAGSTAATVKPTGVVVRVLAIDNNFRPAAIAAKVGDTVEFTNKGKNDHNVLPQSGSGWGVDTPGFHPGDAYSHVFNAPGVYAFYCSIHGTNKVGMVGTITVTG